MTKTLLAAVMIAAGQPPEPALILTGTGTVFECLNETENPNLTCFYIGTERFAVQENFNRRIGTEIEVQFEFERWPSEEGDTFRIFNLTTD